MSLPQFTGEASFYKSPAQYRSAGAWYQLDSRRQASQIIPSYFEYLGPGYCAPGYRYECHPEYYYYGGPLVCGCVRIWQVGLPPQVAG
jgi:hypothetical protein